MKRLAGVETALANFFASGVLRLGDKLGPLLWQLPPATGEPLRMSWPAFGRAAAGSAAVRGGRN